MDKGPLLHSSVALPDVLPSGAHVIPRPLRSLPGPCACTVLRRAAAILAASYNSASTPPVNSSIVRVKYRHAPPTAEASDAASSFHEVCSTGRFDLHKWTGYSK